MRHSTVLIRFLALFCFLRPNSPPPRLRAQWPLAATKREITYTLARRGCRDPSTDLFFLSSSRKPSFRPTRFELSTLIQLWNVGQNSMRFICKELEFLFFFFFHASSRSGRTRSRSNDDPGEDFVVPWRREKRRNVSGLHFLFKIRS